MFGKKKKQEKLTHSEYLWKGQSKIDEAYHLFEMADYKDIEIIADIKDISHRYSHTKDLISIGQIPKNTESNFISSPFEITINGIKKFCKEGTLSYKEILEEMCYDGNSFYTIDYYYTHGNRNNLSEDCFVKLKSGMVIIVTQQTYD